MNKQEEQQPTTCILTN